jgi:hypothetical protein
MCSPEHMIQPATLSRVILRLDLYRAPIRGIKLLEGAAPTHLELNRQCASTELPGTLYRMFEAPYTCLSAFPVTA